MFACAYESLIKVDALWRKSYCDLNVNNPGLFLPSGSPHGAIIHTGQQELIVSGVIHTFFSSLFSPQTHVEFGPRDEWFFNL